MAHTARRPGTCAAVFLGCRLSRSRRPRLGRPFGRRMRSAMQKPRPGRHSPGVRAYEEAGKGEGACQCSRRKVSIPSEAETERTCTSPPAPWYVPVPPVMAPLYGALLPRMISA